MPLTALCACLQHHRFVADSKDKEPEVVFIGDSLVQLMHQCEVGLSLAFCPTPACSLMDTSDPEPGSGRVGGSRSGPRQHRTLRISMTFC